MRERALIIHGLLQVEFEALARGRDRDDGAGGRRRRAAAGAAVTVHVLVADDHPVVRRGVGMILRADPKLKVVAEAADGAEALSILGLQPDVDLAILDLAMPRA